MTRTLAFVYGAVSYLIFLSTFLYAIGFIGNLAVPKSVDSSEGGIMFESLIVDLILLGIFGLQHSVMARPAFKAWWTKIVPKQIERSTYVLLSCAALILMYWQWRPMTAIIWNVENMFARGVIWTAFALGWCIVLLSTFLINHFDLFGLRQVYLNLKGREYTNLLFTERLFYKIVRHPLMLGFLIAFWAAPTMTAGHLLFAIVTTSYILVAIQLEERDIVTEHGDGYVEYRRRVSMLIPIPKRR